jgi:hypothetical protein
LHVPVKPDHCQEFVQETGDTFGPS